MTLEIFLQDSNVTWQWQQLISGTSSDGLDNNINSLHCMESMNGNVKLNIILLGVNESSWTRL